MVLGMVVTALLSVGTTVGGAAAGAHYADNQHKVAGAALGAGAGILVGAMATLIYSAAVADSIIHDAKTRDNVTAGAAAGQMGVSGSAPALPARRADSVTSRLTMVGPLLVAER